MDPRTPSGYFNDGGYYYPAQMPQQMPPGYPNGGQFYPSPMPQQIPQQMPSAYPVNGPSYPFAAMPQTRFAYTQSPQVMWQYQAPWQQQQSPLTPVESDDEKAIRIAFENEQAQLRRKHAEAQRAKEKKRLEEAEAQRVEEKKRLKEVEMARREEAARVEQQRYHIARKEQLRSDPEVLFKDYQEYLRYFRLPPGEKTHPYYTNLLANRRVPKDGDDHEELSLAIQFAYDHCDRLLQYPRDVKDAAQSQREVLRKISEKEEARRKAVAAIEPEISQHGLTLKQIRAQEKWDEEKRRLLAEKRAQLEIYPGYAPAKCI